MCICNQKRRYFFCFYLFFYIFRKYLFLDINTHALFFLDIINPILTVKNVFIQGLSKRFEHLLLWPPRSPDLTHQLTLSICELILVNLDTYITYV